MDDLIFGQLLKVLHGRMEDDLDDNSYDNTVIQFFEAPADSATLTAFINAQVAGNSLSASPSETTTFTAQVSSSTVDPSTLRWSGHVGTQFASTDDYIEFGDISALDLTGSYTVCLQYIPIDAASNQFLTDGSIQFAVDNGTKINCAKSNPITDANQHTIVCVRDVAAHKLYVYVDGALQGSTTEATGSVSTGNTANDLIILLNGTVQNQRIYNRALSAAEISNYVNGVIPRNGLIGEWSLNGNALDTSGNGNNGTITGTQTVYNDARWSYSYGGVWK